MPRKAFSVSEANALLPVLRRVLADLAIRLHDLRENTERLQILDLLWGEKVRAESNPDYREAREARHRVSELAGEIEKLVEEEILARGLRFPQGGLEEGLIDFPTTWQGRRVFLCWRLGEGAVQAWHEVDGGFAGRQPLTAEQALQMGMDDVLGWLDEKIDEDADEGGY